ncbi:ADP-ribose pyrophosphatase [Tritonibacter multivorans]|uniref:ADP-ribose pyrophosphatase n=1 Tax=Tritonibacter multivorans TaxID=928856 RepID=A0A0P1GJF0_9RHOB|nr:NUDIX domain-containing protein [Tritonibacter multivorans]MDA7421625.1 NUDIX domain-containing protein [Tritonibacter multivorans]CUH82056.1 ADP-ribose pyrophosphatase [Tritonibacter multivorans]SFC93481.1 nudix-type nucleoside diphosphatase, YffH/AdpP family [Tritonibacter multivorans]
MALLFLGGALRHDAVLSSVLGRTDPLNTRPALAQGLRERVQNPAAHPVLVEAPADQAEGLLIEVSDEEAARLAHYAGCFGAARANVVAGPRNGPLTDVPSFVAQATEEYSEFDPQWIPVWARMADEIMAYYGRKSPDQITKSLHSMRIRATSWVGLQSQAESPNCTLSRDVVVHAHKREYMNFFAMEEMDLQFRRFDGSMSPVLNRGASMVGQAAVVLPYDPLRDAVLLIEQFRSAPFFMGAKNPWMWEPPAGLIDPGETPEQAARREAKEEAGLTVGHVDYVGGLYSSSGALGEIVHCFVGLADVSEIEGGGGVPGEGEDIRSKVMSFHEFMEAVDGNTFVDMPLVTTALWLARHRDRLRALGQ